jgi:hypothetical protein
MNAVIEGTRPATAPNACQGADCAAKELAADWFGDVEISESVDDSCRDQYGDRV